MSCHEREGRFVTAPLWTSPSRASSVVETFQVAMDNGARRALTPIDPIFYGDVRQGAMKGLDLG